MYVSRVMAGMSAGQRRCCHLRTLGYTVMSASTDGVEEQERERVAVMIGFLAIFSRLCWRHTHDCVGR